MQPIPTGFIAASGPPMIFVGATSIACMILMGLMGKDKINHVRVLWGLFLAFATTAIWSASVSWHTYIGHYTDTARELRWGAGLFFVIAAVLIASDAGGIKRTLCKSKVVAEETHKAERVYEEERSMRREQVLLLAKGEIDPSVGKEFLRHHHAAR